MLHKRDALGLSQAKAADLINMPQRRWSHIENAARPLAAEEIDAITGLLQIPPGPTRPPGLNLDSPTKGDIHLPNEAYYHPQPDRPAHIRYAAAVQRHPAFVKAITAKIKERADFAECEFFCQQLALGSYAEVLAVLRFLERGFEPRLVVPSTVRWLPHPIVDPGNKALVGHRPHLCFESQGTYIFCQTSLMTTRLCTLDFLCWRDGFWYAIEIDGEGHDGSRDAERTSSLLIPVQRWRPEQIVAPGFQF